MALTGKRKAAMLLASLDAATAAELLKGQPQELVQEIAVELSHIDASMQSNPGLSDTVVKDFCTSLQKIISK